MIERALSSSRDNVIVTLLCLDTIRIVSLLAMITAVQAWMIPSSNCPATTHTVLSATRREILGAAVSITLSPPPQRQGKIMISDRQDEDFVESEIRDNFYQTSSYFASSFALITTVNEDGSTTVGPYGLTYPFEVVGKHRSFIVVSRRGSNTDNNVRRTRKCALNFVEYDKKRIETVAELGFPGQTLKEKQETLSKSFHLIDSPAGSSNERPQILAEAYEVFECTLDVERMEANPILRDSDSSHLLLNVDRILLKKKWKDNLEKNGEAMPHPPLFFGLRGGKNIWFADIKEPYGVPLPDRSSIEFVLLETKRFHEEDIRFTRDACEQLAGVPRIFLGKVLQGIVDEAKRQGVRTVNAEFVRQVRR